MVKNKIFEYRGYKVEVGNYGICLYKEEGLIMHGNCDSLKDENMLYEIIDEMIRASGEIKKIKEGAKTCQI